MFHTQFLQDTQSYIVADYNPFSLTVGILTFEKRKPKLTHAVRSFFGPEEHAFHPHTFERNFRQSCEELEQKIGTLPKEVCLFLDHGESIAFSEGYTFLRAHPDQAVTTEEINTYAGELGKQAEHDAYRVWGHDCGWQEHDRRLLSLFLTDLALDKKYHLFPVGKMATHITMRCLFFYGNTALLEGIRRSISLAGHELLTCVPLPVVFLNHLCNQKTFHENHLHVHLGFDTTSVVLHLGKKVHEVQSLPFGWKMLYDDLESYMSPLERESLLSKDDHEGLNKYAEYVKYQEFMQHALQVVFARFGLHWSFSQVSLSTHGPARFFTDMVSAGGFSPWIQPHARCEKLTTDPSQQWLHYCDTLDPLFSIHPHPLLSLVRSVFIDPHAHM